MSTSTIEALAILDAALARGAYGMACQGSESGPDCCYVDLSGGELLGLLAAIVDIVKESTQSAG